MESIRLARLRDAVEEALVDVLVKDRRYSESLIIIDQFGARTGLNHTLCAAKLRALGALGRHREALQVVDKFRQEAVESGIVLSAELVELEQRLLNADFVDTETAPNPGAPQVRVAMGPLFGRIDEVAAVRQLVAENRLVTLVGEGGIGKSSIALAVSSEQLVVWCDLESAESIQEVINRLARSTGRSAPSPSIDRIVDSLGEIEHLVVIDGCPPALPGLSELVTGVLASTPVHILATSRRSLGVSGEHVHRVAPLPTGEASSPAVAMLVGRARAGGAFVDREDPVIGEITLRLDGHPLAIEIVAPRLAALPPADVLANLTGGIGWSNSSSGESSRLTDAVLDTYRLLPDSTQRLFRCLSVFDGGLGIEVARILVQLIGGGSVFARGLLQLAEFSLIRPEAGNNGDLRYRMLTPVADVGRRLAEEADELVEFYRARTQALVRLLEAAQAAGYGEHEGRWAGRISDELSGIRSARLDCITYGWLDLHARLLSGLELESVLRDNTEVQQWASELADHEDLVTTPEASIINAMASNARLLAGDLGGAVRCAALSTQLVERGGRPSWLAHNTLFFISILQQFGEIDERAHQHLAAMRAHSAATGDPMGEVLAEFNVAYVMASVGRAVEGVSAAIACSRLARPHRSPTLSSMGLFSVACVRLSLNPQRGLEQLMVAEERAETGHCVLVHRHALRARLSSTATVDVASNLEWLAKHRHTTQIGQVLQEITGLLVPLAQMGEYTLVARLCGGLSRTLWTQAIATQAAAEFVASRLGDDVYRIEFRRGKRLDPQGIIDLILTASDEH
jgi:hypothetical protein